MRSTQRLIRWTLYLMLVCITTTWSYPVEAVGTRRTYTIYLPVVRNPLFERLVFAAAVGGSSDVYTIRGDGGQLTRLGLVSQIAGRPQNPVWSPDGTRIAFAALNNANNSTIYVVRADGTGLVRLTTSQVDAQPSWSPDGKQIAFVSGRAGSARIYTMHADGSQQTAVTTPGNDENDTQPAWSPDGRQIAFIRTNASGALLYVATAGSQPTRLTNSTTTNYAWAPDSQEIACVLDTKLAVVPLDGSGATILTNAPETSYSGLAWSSNDAIIFAASQRGNYDLYSITANNSRATRLTTNAADDINPSVSPEGSIAFLSYAGDHWVIVAMRTDGSQQQLVTLAVTSASLAWAAS